MVPDTEAEAPIIGCDRVLVGQQMRKRAATACHRQ